MNEELENINLAIPDIYQPLLDRLKRLRGVMICEIGLSGDSFDKLDTGKPWEHIFFGVAAKHSFCKAYKRFVIGEE